MDSLILLEPGVPSDADPEFDLEPAIERYHQGDAEGTADELMHELWGDEWRTELPNAVPGGVEQVEHDVSTLVELELPALADWEFDAEMADGFSRPVLHLRRSERAPEDRAVLRSWFPQTEEYVVDCADHTLQMKEPQVVAEGIADFLGRHRS